MNGMTCKRNLRIFQLFSDRHPGLKGKLTQIPDMEIPEVPLAAAQNHGISNIDETFDRIFV